MKKLLLMACSLFLGMNIVNAQSTDSLYQNNAVSLITKGAGGAVPGGNLWGYAFGDYAYMGQGDSAGRGTKEQYKGLGAYSQTQNPNALEVRRAYLGYDYTINEKFSANALLAYEGDYDGNGNRTVYLKYIYFKWKNIFKGSDLRVGQQATNSFANAYNTEPLMGYRSVEKTILDMHGVDGSADMGIGLEGKIVKFIKPTGTSFIGYNVMIRDYSGNNPVPGFAPTSNPGPAFTSGQTLALNSTSDKDKKFSGNVYFNTLHNKLTIGAYMDYINYGNVPYKPLGTVFQDAVQTVKGYAVYNSKYFGIGGEWFMQTMTNGETEVYKTTAEGTNDTTNASQTGYSIFAHVTLMQNKLNIFARYDMYTPDSKYSYNANETFTSRMSNVSGSGNGNSYTENFINAGLDWTPTDDKKVHIMPNIWYYGIKNGYGSDNLASDNYMVYRITFLFAFR